MKIYLAGSCSSDSRTLLVRLAKALRASSNNYEVYCPFELKIENAWDMSQEQWADKVYREDIKALNSCDVLIVITPGRHSSAGINYEQGFAKAVGIPVIVMQYTDDETSLMTYCGCNIFRNTNKKDIIWDTQCALRVLKEENYSEYKVRCKTTLT